MPDTCCNNRRSGLAGGALEAKNFRSVGKVLRCFGKRVCVLDVESTADFFVGRWLGVYMLGSDRGICLGTLVWSRSDQHVFVSSERTHGWLGAGACCHSAGHAAWNACNVGAPKNKTTEGRI